MTASYLHSLTQYSPSDKYIGNVGGRDSNFQDTCCNRYKSRCRYRHLNTVGYNMDEELKKVLKEEPFQEVGKIFISSVR